MHNGRPEIWYNFNMSKILEDAIQKIRELPEADQEEAAEMLLSVASRSTKPVQLDDGTRAAVLEGREQARRDEFVSDSEMAAFYARHGIEPARSSGQDVAYDLLRLPAKPA